MFMVILRPLIIIVLFLVGVYFLVRKSKRTIKNDIRKEKLEDAIYNIDTTLKEVESLPKLNIEKLEKAREKLKGIFEGVSVVPERAILNIGKTALAIDTNDNIK